MGAPEMLPAPLLAAGVRRATTLDVRPVLEKGGDPFGLIMKTLATVPKEEALHLLVSFEPVPLYAVLAAQGRAHHVEKRGGGLVEVWFFTSPGSSAAAETLPAGDERVPLQPPVALDVRGLEPPQPMIAILQKLVDLGPGAQLEVRHHREPVMLYDKLKLRGYGATCTPQPEGDFLVRIAPEWALR